MNKSRKNASTLTDIQIVLEADTNVSILRVSGNSEPCLSLNRTFSQIYVLLRARVHDFNVQPLALAGAYVRCDDDECAEVRRVPYTLAGRVPVCLYLEFNGVDRCKKE